MHKHLRLTCYALLCLLVPIGVMAQTEHTYLDRALPGSWSEEGSDFQQTLPVEDNWWRNFKDPLLDSLIEVAVKQNYSVRMAMDRIAMAKANLRSAQGSYSPTLGLSAGWTRQQSSGNINQVPKAITQYSSATVDMNWEVDVFGSIRNRVKAEKENFAASKEEYNAAMVSLCAQVASSYINMRELQQEVKVAQQNCRSQQTVVQITQKRYETGLVSKLDVAQAQSVYYSTKASLPGGRYHPIRELLGDLARPVPFRSTKDHGDRRFLAGIYRAGRCRATGKPVATPSGCTCGRTAGQCACRLARGL